MATRRFFDFILHLGNIDELKKMIDDLCQYQEESAFINVQFWLPEKGKRYDRNTGKYKNFIEPAQLIFSLTRPEYDPEDGIWLISPYGYNLYFDETRVDKRYKGSGEIARALPPFFDGKELPQEILEDVLLPGGWEISDD